MIQIDRGRITAIILAAGSGSRMGCDIPKQRISLLGESILHRSVRAFSECRLIDSIVVVVRGDELDWAKAELADVIKIHSIVSGGATRAESARAGFLAVPDGTDFVAIHDGARCLVTDDIICRVVEAAFTHKAATACVEVTDTVKTLDGEGMINGTVARARLRAAQTPQVFGREVYARAILALDEGAEFTDDNSLLEALGERIYPVICDKENIKITTAEDIAYAEYILKGREQMDEIRIGHGYDVHRLAEGRRLILGGVDIPFEKGLVGHSDADVLTHAIMDALLGACGLGDIGRHFPDNDQIYKDISSLLLLDRVRELLLQEGIKIVNIDATLVLQQPKIAPFVDSMRENISKILKIEQGRINIKATTEEGLGFTGRGEGVCAYAVASVEK